MYDCITISPVIYYIYRYVSNEECACITMPACLKGVHVSLCPVKGVVMYHYSLCL